MVFIHDGLFAWQVEAGVRADESGTAFWRLTEGRGSEDGKSAAGRIDFVLQVGCSTCDLSASA